MQSENGLPKGWRKRSISEVAAVRFSSVDKKSLDGETPVRLCNYMEVWKNGYIHKDMPFMQATASTREIAQFRLKRHDVLLTKDSETKHEIAQASVVRDDLDHVVLGYHLALIRPKPREAYGPFVAAQLNEPQFHWQFVRVAGGATRYGLGLDAVKGGMLWLPTVAEQRRIAKAIQGVDDAIEQTRDVIDQTRRLKTALLQDLLTHGLPGRHSEFKEVRGLGMMPASWDVVRLDNLAKVDRGKFTHRPRNEPKFYGGDIPFVQTGDVGAAGDYLTSHSQTLNELGLSISRIFPAGTILLVIAGSVGEPTIASYDVAFPDSVVGITAKEGINQLFLLRVLQYAQARIIRTATESAQANISLELLRPLPMPLPEKEERDAIANILRSVEQRIEKETSKLNQLSQAKAALSQALLTGRVCARVSAEKESANVS